MILIIHHDPQEVAAIAQAVKAVGHDVMIVDEGQAWLSEPEHIEADVIVIGKPIDRPSLDMLNWVRDRTGVNLPILFVTNESRRAEIAVALRSGANDAIALPFDADELSARLHVLLRNARHDSRCDNSRIDAGMYQIDVLNRWVWLKSTRIALTPREFDLTILFFTHIDQLLTREILLRRIWGECSEFSSHSLSSHVYRLKRKLKIEPSHGFYLKTYYSVGYRLQSVSSLYEHDGVIPVLNREHAPSSVDFDLELDVWSSGKLEWNKAD
jgi:DNA-binding response OmpR family regulator